MNNNKRKYQEPEVYSTTGFKDVLASPVFYSIATIAFVLGISTIFGFLQNPIKLKAVVSVINQKVSPSSPVKSSIKQNAYSLTESFYTTRPNNRNKKQDNAILFQDISENYGMVKPIEDGLQRISFNYDVTSTQFWNDLDSSSIESVVEESDREEIEASMIGIPLESDFQTNQIDDSIYVLKI